MLVTKRDNPIKILLFSLCPPCLSVCVLCVLVMCVEQWQKNGDLQKWSMGALWIYILQKQNNHDDSLAEGEMVKKTIYNTRRLWGYSVSVAEICGECVCVCVCVEVCDCVKLFGYPVSDQCWRFLMIMMMKMLLLCWWEVCWEGNWRI